jgi:Ran GTPase-activating protein (RanGAP) involved in mRNA processing and transport
MDVLSYTNISTLILDKNKISEQGGQAVAEMLQDNSTLSRLDIKDNQLGNVAAVAIATALKSNSTLRTLNLFHNIIGTKGTELYLRYSYAVYRGICICGSP